MSIFDRWGNEVFESNSINNGWDGRYKGQILQQDIYIYQIDYTTFNTSKHFIGRVLLIK